MDTKKIAGIKAKLDALMEEVYRTIETEFEAVSPLEGVNPPGEGNSIFTVSFSAIQRSPGHILSASYYDSEAQKTAVVQTLIGDKPTIERLIARLEKVCGDKKVETRTQGLVRLNPHTLDVAAQLLITLKGE